MLNRLVLSSFGKPVSLFNTGKITAVAIRDYSEAVVAVGKAVKKEDEEIKIVLPEELKDRLMKYPSQLEGWQSYKMPGKPYEGMGPLPPVQDYEETKKQLKLYFIPKHWFDFFYDRTGVTGPYVFAGALFTFLASKEYYMFGHNYGHHSRQIFWSFLTFGYLNQQYGSMVRDQFEEWRTEKYIAMDTIKEEEVSFYYAEKEKMDLDKWRAGLFEPINAARELHLSVMLDTAFMERQALVAREVKKRLDYQVASKIAMNEVSQEHMTKWIENKAMESVRALSQSKILEACIADLHKLSEGKETPAPAVS